MKPMQIYDDETLTRTKIIKYLLENNIITIDTQTTSVNALADAIDRIDTMEDNLIKVFIGSFEFHISTEVTPRFSKEQLNAALKETALDMSNYAEIKTAGVLRSLVNYIDELEKQVSELK